MREIAFRVTLLASPHKLPSRILKWNNHSKWTHNSLFLKILLLIRNNQLLNRSLISTTKASSRTGSCLVIKTTRWTWTAHCRSRKFNQEWEIYWWWRIPSSSWRKKQRALVLASELLLSLRMERTSLITKQKRSMAYHSKLDLNHFVRKQLSLWLSHATFIYKLSLSLRRTTQSLMTFMLSTRVKASKFSLTPPMNSGIKRRHPLRISKTSRRGTMLNTLSWQR